MKGDYEHDHEQFGKDHSDFYIFLCCLFRKTIQNQISIDQAI